MDDHQARDLAFANAKTSNLDSCSFGTLDSAASILYHPFATSDQKSREAPCDVRPYQVGL